MANFPPSNNKLTADVVLMTLSLKECGTNLTDTQDVKLFVHDTFEPAFVIVSVKHPQPQHLSHPETAGYRSTRHSTEVKNSCMYE